MAEKFLRSLTVGGKKMSFLPASQGDGKEGKVLKVINGEWAIGTFGEVESIGPWLKFKGNEDFTLMTNNTTKSWDGNLYYSTDTQNWNEWDGTEISSSNKVLYLRGTGNSIITGASYGENGWVFNKSDTLKIEAIGNIENLLDYETVERGEHPVMGEFCYLNMFGGCISLTTPPELPATTLANYCYLNMFGGCISLTTPPELPATTLANYCYADMFYGCTSLTTAPELPATTLAEDCYSYMFDNCTSLTIAPELPATTLASSCYSYMFYGCTSLTTAPELPATTLANYCYSRMFYGCTSLNIYSSVMDDAIYAWTAPKSAYTNNMFYDTNLDGSTFPNSGTPTEGTTYYWATSE